MSHLFSMRAEPGNLCGGAMKIKRENQDMSKRIRLSLFLFFSHRIATHDNDNFWVMMQGVGVSFKDKVDGSAGR